MPPVPTSNTDVNADGASVCKVLIEALSSVVSGFVHECNNKIGPILLNAESIASADESVAAAASDIAHNAREILHMMRDIETLLPSNLRRETSLSEMLRLGHRLSKGALRRRRLQVDWQQRLDEFDALDAFRLDDPLTAFLGMMLMTQVFHGPKEGGMGVLRVSVPRSGQPHLWRISVDPPAAPDEGALESLSRLLAHRGLKVSSGFGQVDIAKGMNAT